MKIVLWGVLFIAFVALGLSGIVWVTSLPTFNLVKATLILIPAISFMLYLSVNKDPLKLCFFMAILLLPILGVIVPPVRLQLTMFDFFGLMAVGLLLIAVAKKGKGIDLFPIRYLWIPIVFVIPSFLLSIDYGTSAIQFLRMLEIYAIFIAGYYYLQLPESFQKYHLILACVLLVVSLFVVLQKVAGINLMIYQERGAVSAGNMMIQQGSGLFQDPQKAGQFIAVLLAYFSILIARKAVIGKWLKRIVYIAIILSVFGLLLTVSRLAIATGFAVILGAFFFLSKAGIFYRFFLGSVAIAAVILIVALGSRDFIRFVVPAEVAQRFELAESSGKGRFEIWEDTFHIFMDNPVVGIGPGSYQEYLIQSDSAWKRYRDMGGVVPIQPESGYLKVLYEIGVVGFLGFLYFFIAAITDVVRQLRFAKTKEVASYAWAALGGVVIYITTFVTLFTPSDPRNAILPLLLLLALKTKVKQQKLTEDNEKREGDQSEMIARTAG